LKAAAGPPPFPWDEAMRIGLGLLRLSPNAFWAMTPIEFERAVGMFAPDRGMAPDRRALAALMRAFPDTATRETRIG
jgi:uncharacterized phage protein (TIGR02216 family)